MAEEDKKPIEQVRFIYQKTRHHRTFHADGLWAGITPQLEVQIAFFNNLRPMPQDVTHKIIEGGQLGEGTETPGEQHVIREVDASVVLNRDTARGAIELLQRMLKQIDQSIEQDKALRNPGDNKPKVV
jgi:hypothetical protein